MVAERDVQAVVGRPERLHTGPWRVLDDHGRTRLLRSPESPRRGHSHHEDPTRRSHSSKLRRTVRPRVSQGPSLSTPSLALCGVSEGLEPLYLELLEWYYEGGDRDGAKPVASRLEESLAASPMALFSAKFPELLHPGDARWAYPTLADVGQARLEQVKAIMDAGELVSDAVVTALIGERLDGACGQGAIFDGFPRTKGQAEALDHLLSERGRHLDHVIELAVDEDALVQRITGRFSCAKCGTGYHDTFKPTKAAGVCDVCGSTEFVRRKDDNEETVRTRMAEYRAKTAPILPYYDERGLVRRVDGMASVDQVAAQIGAILDGEA